MATSSHLGKGLHYLSVEPGTRLVLVCPEAGESAIDAQIETAAKAVPDPPTATASNCEPMPAVAGEAADEHAVWILWGSAESRRENTPDRYVFDTAAELDAFLEGVDAASGWLDYLHFDSQEEADAIREDGGGDDS